MNNRSVMLFDQFGTTAVLIRQNSEKSVRKQEE